jgi:hypothetical protein
MLNKFPYAILVVAMLCSFPVKAQDHTSKSDLEYYIRVLERKVELQNDSMHRLERNLTTAKVDMLKEHLKNTSQRCE